MPRSGPAEVGESELRQLLVGLTAVWYGDFGARLPDAADGLMGQIFSVFNGMVDRLSLVTSEVTRFGFSFSAQLLGQSDDDALRAAEVAEQIAVLEPGDLADEFGAVRA